MEQYIGTASQRFLKYSMFICFQILFFSTFSFADEATKQAFETQSKYLRDTNRQKDKYMSYYEVIYFMHICHGYPVRDVIHGFFF